MQYQAKDNEIRIMKKKSVPFISQKNIHKNSCKNRNQPDKNCVYEPFSFAVCHNTSLIH